VSHRFGRLGEGVWWSSGWACAATDPLIKFVALDGRVVVATGLRMGLGGIIAGVVMLMMGRKAWEYLRAPE
jgi:hypothetical protein